jgi:hypothetical protein
VNSHLDQYDNNQPFLMTAMVWTIHNNGVGDVDVDVVTIDS